ncbi:S8 family serine peptidase [Bacteroidota bacterium]
MNTTNRLVLLIFIVFFASVAYGQQVKYWIGFTDKDNNDFSLFHPEEFLSEKSIERRKVQKIDIDLKDLPVSKKYIDSISRLGLNMIYSLKWLNGVVVEGDSTVPYALFTTSFVKDVRKIYDSGNKKFAKIKKLTVDKNIPDFGDSRHQIEMMNGHFLHNLGFKGNGMTIAVLDAGFTGVDQLQGFSDLFNTGRILTTRDFVDMTDSVFHSNTHGTKVLSLMAGFLEGIYHGTAIDANYLLLRTEDSNSEQPIEMYNWIAGAEFADSFGVDIINSSLGYSSFDNPDDSYYFEELDGNTTIVTIGADIAASKGILVVASAGNEGNDPWKYIVAPSDGDSVLCVAAVDSLKKHAWFSSIGPRSDKVLKPDVAAMGNLAYVFSLSGFTEQGSGTSYSAPLVSGMSASLWQAFPTLKNSDIIRAIQVSGDSVYNLNPFTGYGIPDFEKAYSYLNNRLNNIQSENRIMVYPTFFNDYFNLELLEYGYDKILLEMYNSHGIKVIDKAIRSAEIVNNTVQIKSLSNLAPGFYIVRVSLGEYFKTYKLFKF